MNPKYRKHFVPLDDAIYEAIAGERPPRTVRGFACCIDGRPVAMVGVYLHGNGYVLACEATPEFRQQLHTFAAKRLVVRAIWMAYRMVDELRLPVYALADPNIPGSALLLKHMGWNPLRQNIFVQESAQCQVH